MKILLVHQNFPGQFLHLAPALAKAGHEVVGLTQETNKRLSPVRVARYRTPEPTKITGLVRTFSEAVERGLIAARAADQLRQTQGFVPDVVFGHTGWGETLFMREAFPQARHLAYAEFLYRSTGQDTDFDPEFRSLGLNPRITVTARAAHHIQAIALADAGVSPTSYQASTFYPELRSKLRVIHDGIDTARVRPDPAAALELPNGRTLRAGDEVLSFVNRHLEPYRGYHVFMRSLPAILQARPNAQVVIVGGEGQSYGARPPEGQTWKQRFLDEVRGSVDLSRIHFLGQVPYDRFLTLMQVTRVHAYLTYPFVLSWSMLEAMAAGALVVGSRTPPVAEVIEDGVNGRLVDFFDIEGWSETLIRALADPGAAMPLRRMARQTVVERYDLQTVCLPKMMAFVEGRPT